MTVTAALLALGAIARITRFLTSDVLFDPVRDRIERRFGSDSRICYLLSCPWCASIWVAAGVSWVAAAAGAITWAESVPFALLTSYMYGLLAQHLDD